MSISSKVLHSLKRVRLFVTKIHLRLLSAKALRTSIVTLPNGRSIEVIVFSSKKRGMLGLTNIIGAVAIDERCYRTPNILNFVVAHESAHQRSWYTYFLMPVIAASLSCGLLTLCYVLFLLLVLLLQRNPTNMQAFATLFIPGIVFVFIACICSQFLEYKADCKSIRLLGLETVSQARKEVSALLPKPSLSWRIYGAITHPPLAFTIKVCCFFNRDQGLDSTNKSI